MQANHPRLPPLNAVRAFEAAARLGGFNAAGAELNLSADAVGRLVKILEDSLGVPLFRRLPRRVVVTGAGGRYLARVGTLLDQLGEATVDVQRLETSRVLTVGAMPPMVFALADSAPRSPDSPHSRTTKVKDRQPITQPLSAT